MLCFSLAQEAVDVNDERVCGEDVHAVVMASALQIRQGINECLNFRFCSRLNRGSRGVALQIPLQARCSKDDIDDVLVVTHKISTFDALRVTYSVEWVMQIMLFK